MQSDPYRIRCNNGSYRRSKDDDENATQGTGGSSTVVFNDIYDFRSDRSVASHQTPAEGQESKGSIQIDQTKRGTSFPFPQSEVNNETSKIKRKPSSTNNFLKSSVQELDTDGPQSLESEGQRENEDVSIPVSSASPMTFPKYNSGVVLDPLRNLEPNLIKYSDAEGVEKGKKHHHGHTTRSRVERKDQPVPDNVMAKYKTFESTGRAEPYGGNDASQGRVCSRPSGYPDQINFGGEHEQFHWNQDNTALPQSKNPRIAKERWNKVAEKKSNSFHRRGSQLPPVLTEWVQEASSEVSSISEPLASTQYSSKPPANEMALRNTGFQSEGGYWSTGGHQENSQCILDKKAQSALMLENNLRVKCKSIALLQSDIAELKAQIECNSIEDCAGKKKQNQDCATAISTLQLRQSELEHIQSKVEETKRAYSTLQFEVETFKVKMEEADAKEGNELKSKCLLGRKPFIVDPQKDEELYPENNQAQVETLHEEVIERALDCREVKIKNQSNMYSLGEDRNELVFKLGTGLQQREEIIIAVKSQGQKKPPFWNDSSITKIEESKLDNESLDKIWKRETNGKLIQAREKLEKSIKTIINLQQALTAKQKFALDLQERVLDLTKSLEKLQGPGMESLQKYSASKDERCRAEENQFKELEIERVANATKIDGLKNKLEEKEEVLSTARDDLARSRATVDGKFLVDEEDMKQMQSQLQLRATQNETHSEETCQMMKENQNLLSKASKLQAKVEQAAGNTGRAHRHEMEVHIKEENLALKNKLLHMDEEIADATHQKEILVNDLCTIKKENKDMKGKILDLETQIKLKENNAAKDKLKSIQDKEIHQKYYEAVEENSKLKQSVSELQSTVAMNEVKLARVASLESVVFQLKNENATMEKDQSQKITKLEALLKESSQRRDDTIERCNIVEKENEELTKVVSSSRDSVSDLERKLIHNESVNATVHELQRENKIIQQQHHVAVEKMKADLTKMTHQRNEVEKKLQERTKLLTRAESMMAMTNSATLTAMMDALNKQKTKKSSSSKKNIRRD